VFSVGADPRLNNEDYRPTRITGSSEELPLTKDIPVLSSERAPHKDKTVTVKQ
jgi:hypothetical protein